MHVDGGKQPKEDSMMTSPRIDSALLRLRGMFMASQGRPLSFEDLFSRSGTDETTCAALLWALENSKFVSRSESGGFLLRSAPADSD
jgi:hypothetical protein